MELITQFIQIFLHLDKHLDTIIQNYGAWTYGIMFLIIFCETGFVVTPFLPGDSLLFAAGTFAARGSFKVAFLCVLLSLAAIAGDAANYFIGYMIGPKLYEKKHYRFIKREYLERTHRFYEKYGKLTIILARFVPIIRTFAPFLAGVGTMTYFQFATYNVIGGVAWVSLFVFGGYFFGNIPVVRDNFSFVILAIIIISAIPPAIEFLRHRRQPSA